MSELFSASAPKLTARKSGRQVVSFDNSGAAIDTEEGDPSPARPAGTASIRGPPESIGHNGGPSLYGSSPVLFDLWFDSRFPKPGGYSERQRRHIARRYRLPVIRVGWNRLIVPLEGDAVLAGLARRRDEPEQQPPRRGRPRKYSPIAAD